MTKSNFDKPKNISKYYTKYQPSLLNGLLVSLICHNTPLAEHFLFKNYKESISENVSFQKLIPIIMTWYYYNEIQNIFAHKSASQDKIIMLDDESTVIKLSEPLQYDHIIFSAFAFTYYMISFKDINDIHTKFNLNTEFNLNHCLMSLFPLIHSIIPYLFNQVGEYIVTDYYTGNPVEINPWAKGYEVDMDNLDITQLEQG